MSNKNKNLDKLVGDIGSYICELEKCITSEKIEKVEIPFPCGVLRTARYFRQELTFIKDNTLKRNLAYHLILTDLHRWILNRFGIGLTAKEMFIKEGICLLGNICAAVVRHIAWRLGTKKRKGRDPGIKACLTFLVQKGIFDNEFKKYLEWLWNIRCNEHIEYLKDWEYQKYSLKDYNQAVLIWKKLKEYAIKAEELGIL
ncbi:MAG: hypothetical protein ABIK49_06145 [candidate division WOR-3 bacterium]